MSKADRIHGHLHEVYDAFQEVKAAMVLTGNLSDKACLAQLIEAYHAAYKSEVTPHEIEPETIIQLAGYTIEEIDRINQALSVDYANIWDMVKEGVLLVADRRNQYLSPDNHLENARLRKASHFGSREHVAATIAQMMHANEQAEYSLAQVYISINMVKKVGHLGEHTVRAYFAEYQEAIDTHNQQVVDIGSAKQGDRHNLMHAKYMQAVKNGTAEVFLARHGKRLVSRNGQHHPEEVAL